MLEVRADDESGTYRAVYTVRFAAEAPVPKGVIPPENLWVITNEFLQAEIRKQLPEVPKEQIMAEPSIAGMRVEGEKLSPDGLKVVFLWNAENKLPRDLYLTTTDGRGGGNGLPGMRERAAVHGGTVEAGPTLDGGFRLVAELPIGVPA